MRTQTSMGEVSTVACTCKQLDWLLNVYQGWQNSADITFAPFPNNNNKNLLFLCKHLFLSFARNLCITVGFQAKCSRSVIFGTNRFGFFFWHYIKQNWKEAAKTNEFLWERYFQIPYKIRIEKKGDRYTSCEIMCKRKTEGWRFI